MESVALPKVTPYLLRRADSMCARRLARSVEGGERSSDPVNRSRMRDAFLAAARQAHAELRAPNASHFEGIGADLEPEERIVLERAAFSYVQLFGARRAEYFDHGLDDPTVSRRLGLRLGGWIDLAVVGEDGTKELRQFDLWNGRAPNADPLELDAVKAAVLRLAQWARDEPLRVVWADLVWGTAIERVVDVPAELDDLRGWLDDRVAIVRERIAVPEARSGQDCAGCIFVAACPEHPTGAHFSARRGDLLPGIIAVTPTSLDAWHRCRREWRNRYALQIPASDLDQGTFHGQKVHDILRFVHEQGDCRDDAHVADVLAAHGLDDDPRFGEEVVRHTRRCPDGAQSFGHEVTHARFHRTPLPLFMATARFDAIWLHDGVLDARDYKTGQVWSDRVREDRQARVQAWVLAPLAERLGARLRIAFEHLAVEIADDPEPFEPDADDLAQIEDELRSTVAAMRAEVAYQGIAEREICGRCRYRSICPDSAARSEPVWPVVEPDDADADA
ncbi:MAG: PD-(D/E)XK nuclease family protein [Acidimicrobiia bacterium]